jgi:hypothetical protein
MTTLRQAQAAVEPRRIEQVAKYKENTHDNHNRQNERDRGKPTGFLTQRDSMKGSRMNSIRNAKPGGRTLRTDGTPYLSPRYEPKMGRRIVRWE